MPGASAQAGATAAAPKMSPSRSAPALAWNKARRMSTIASKFATAKTMFDDGRYMQSIVDEAKAQGLQVAAGRGVGGAPPLLAKKLLRAQERPPTVSVIEDSWEGGGGVRIFPPDLDESVPEGVADCFVPAK